MADRLVFVSGRTGNGDIYLLDLKTRALTRLTREARHTSTPGGRRTARRIVMMHGSNENHDILVINDVTRPTESAEALTTWPY